MYQRAKVKRQLAVSTDLAVTKPFGYVNEEDPFEDDAKYELQPWWELVPDSDRLLTHEMMSEALWHAVMRSAEQIRYKYIKSVPAVSDASRQREAARSMIMKMQLLSRLASNWRNMNLLQPNAVNFNWLTQTIEGMQQSFQKRYGAAWPVPD